MRRMNEHEAWLHLAKMWSGPPRGRTVAKGLEPCEGLCQCLYRMATEWTVGFGVLEASPALISERTRDAMFRRAERNMPKRKGGAAYWWPRNAQGAKERARFCRRMARLTA